VQAPSAGRQTGKTGERRKRPFARPKFFSSKVQQFANGAQTIVRRFLLWAGHHILARQNLGAHGDDTPVDHAERARRSGAEIEDAAAVKWAAIGDGHDDATPGFHIGDADARAKWK
jgi:hypothetical protein